MDFDFIEIGTSNFDTCLQSCKDTEQGISVEPLDFYLNALPDKSNVKKVCAAITSNKPCSSINIFYIPPHIVDLYHLPQWFKGCNKIGNYHPLHILHNVQTYVKIHEVPLLNIDEFMIQENVHTVQFLKIDTEGHDCIIMDGLFNYLIKKDSSYYPRKIQFETNENTFPSIVDKVIENFKSLGYVVAHRGHDTLLEYKPRNDVHCF